MSTNYEYEDCVTRVISTMGNALKDIGKTVTKAQAECAKIAEEMRVLTKKKENEDKIQ